MAPVDVASHSSQTNPTTTRTSSRPRVIRFAALAGAFAGIGALGATLASSGPRTMEAEATIEVGAGADAATARALGPLPLVLEPAAADLSVEVRALADHVVFTTVNGTRLVTIRTRANSAATALAAAEAVATSLNAATTSNPEARGRILGPARLRPTGTTPWSPASRGALAGLAVAAAAGALLTAPRADRADAEPAGSPA